MAYITVWYWQYSLAFPISLIAILVVYFCCRVICLKQIRRQDVESQNRQRPRPNTPAQNQQVYTITTVVVPDQCHPPTYKGPNPAFHDQPPSYDEALILHNEVVAKGQQQIQVPPTA